jgi:hypothetical protein
VHTCRAQLLDDFDIVRLGEEARNRGRHHRTDIRHLLQRSLSAAISASRLPKWRARSFAVASPTLRMPKAKMKRASVVDLLFPIAASRFAADFSAMRSRLAIASRPSL